MAEPFCHEAEDDGQHEDVQQIHAKAQSREWNDEATVDSAVGCQLACHEEVGYRRQCNTMRCPNTSMASSRQKGMVVEKSQTRRKARSPRRDTFSAHGDKRGMAR